MKRIVQAASLLFATLMFLWPSLAWADSEIKLAGFVDVPPAGPGGTLTLPLAPGSPSVTVLLTFGIPAVSVPITITPATEIEAEEGGTPVTLSDGDRVKIEAVIDTTIVATKLEVEEFPELEVIGTAGGLPMGGVALPLPPGSTPVDFTLTLVPSVVLPVRLTVDSKVEDDPFTLQNGDTIQIEGVVRDLRILITEIESASESD